MRTFFASSFWATALIASSAVVDVASAEPTSYDGHQVVRVKTPRNGPSIRTTLRDSGITYDEWEQHEGRSIDIALSPRDFTKFESLGLDFHTMHADLGASIRAEQAASSSWKNKRDLNDSLAWFDSYHPYDDHKQWWNDLQASFPNQSEIISSGTSYEGRDLFGLHFWGKGGKGKPVVLYHASVHAREWITTPVVEFLALQLITGYKSGDNLTTELLDKYDFYILPFVNPDGFVYTQTTERLWRKNRQPGPGNSTCYGRDINRNWEFGWAANDRGASTNPCSQTYKGEAPSDTPENQGLDKLVRELGDGPGIKLFIDWHSYGQYILSPYGYNETLYAPELGKWTKAASYVSETIRDSSPARTTFTFGPSGATLYTTTGAAPDHVYEIGGAEFSYTIELRDTGDFGFVLPPEQIRPTAEEQWAGQQVLLSLLDEVFFDGEGPALEL